MTQETSPTVPTSENAGKAENSSCCCSAGREAALQAPACGTAAAGNLNALEANDFQEGETGAARSLPELQASGRAETGTESDAPAAASADPKEDSPPHAGSAAKRLHSSVAVQETKPAEHPTRPDPSQWPIIPEGTYILGTDDGEGFASDAEGPARPVHIPAFRISPYAVTNAEFAAFVQATGYVTEAEKFGWSYVFQLLIPDPQQVEIVGSPERTPWWLGVEGATWREPEGPGSGIVDRMDHPVVHVSWNDAAAYCAWAGVRLPTEVEWEAAARGGLERKRYPWGDVLRPGGEHRCNIWQGVFPTKNHASDGYLGTAPVDAYLPNGYGLYNMSGNVWEWCRDWFTSDPAQRGSSDRPEGPAQGNARLMKGGSYLCHQSYCNRYRAAARSGNTPDSSTGNIGFRVVADL
ncbi:formylglycine-generating enzyme family protein [Paenibacillus favisporus]|uniref:formylglycine-generating enzyme family protein n=1 Tax=Paenibacillus favisporus TaxID=221028 RepID=UPI0013D3ECEF|nr:formylglycine-generating enzyme family protein [Paenibacillus favisporus]